MSGHSLGRLMAKKSMFFQLGSASCRWRYWSRMIACCYFHCSKYVLSTKTRHLSSAICAAIQQCVYIWLSLIRAVKLRNRAMMASSKICSSWQVSLDEMPSNREVLEVLMSRPIGLFSILDEESKFPSANDSTFIAKMEAHLAEMSAGVYHRCVAWKWCNG